MNFLQKTSRTGWSSWRRWKLTRRKLHQYLQTRGLGFVTMAPCLQQKRAVLQMHMYHHFHQLQLHLSGLFHTPSTQLGLHLILMTDLHLLCTEAAVLLTLTHLRRPLLLWLVHTLEHQLATRLMSTTTGWYHLIHRFSTDSWLVFLNHETGFVTTMTFLMSKMVLL